LEVNAQTTVEIPPKGAAGGSEPRNGAERGSRAQLSQLALQLHAREVYCREIERALVTAHGKIRGQAFRIAELHAELGQRQIDTPQRQIDTPEPQIDRPEPHAHKLQPSQTPVQSPSVAPVQHDDLRRIRGIGPRFAQRLAALGVTSFDTIADWSAADVARIAKQLGVTPERLTRDWIKQARALKKPQRRKRVR
jgi:predicted flap endonuclease-1-like 5' DNA nuclease